MNIELSSEKFRLERGYVWPINDVGCAQVVFDFVGLETACQHCKTFDVAVQAGGNCGVWPVALSKKFKSVYTFEPDPTNFFCLGINTPQPNIFKFNAALGDNRGCVDMALYEHNTGAHYVAGPGPIPVLRIDDLGLSSCGLIYLDVEGYEFDALRGGLNTIKTFRPVIGIEDKGMSDKFGYKKGDIEHWLVNVYNYQVVSRPRRDVIFAPC